MASDTEIVVVQSPSPPTVVVVEIEREFLKVDSDVVNTSVIISDPAHHVIDTVERVAVVALGAQGPAGGQGKSAYQIAVDNGFVGTEQDWLNLLSGSIDDSSSATTTTYSSSKIEQLVSDADKTYEHAQNMPSDTWIVSHGLNKYVSVTVVDSGGSMVEGTMVYDSLNQVTITFNATFSGKAYLN